MLLSSVTNITCAFNEFFEKGFSNESDKREVGRNFINFVKIQI